MKKMLKLLNRLLNKCGLYTKTDLWWVANAVADNDVCVELHDNAGKEDCVLYVRADIFKGERNRALAFFTAERPELLKAYTRIAG